MFRLALLLCACVAFLAACGEEPDDPPPIFDVEPPRGEEVTSFPEAGMSITRPSNWRLRRQEAPEVFEMVSGEAVIAAWAYPREEPLPETDAELEAARKRLLDAIAERDPEFEILSGFSIDEVAGAPAIDVSGSQVIAKRELRTRSVHIFKGEVEYVIESIVPTPDHALVEERVMQPLLDSVELEGQVTEGAE